MPDTKTEQPAESPASDANPVIKFADLPLPEAILKAVNDTGYDTPTPIQAATIPAVLDGKDVVGLAQTGTGKTAAFSLPLLSNIEIGNGITQALILAPTRELAMQVSEALQTYAKYLPTMRILPIYGGASYKTQLDGLRKGSEIVVGTPGRVIDHLNRGSLKLENLKTLVLDEADEMLRMGFIEDVEQILEHTPDSRQVVLFSATMPPAISKIAKRYLTDPVNVRIKSETTTAPTIDQEYWQVDRGKNRKQTALKMFLTIKPFDAAILFSRTKAGTEDLADLLGRWGYRAAALNGDMNQHQREKTVEQLKSGGLDIICATDVAARGLDVRRISLVINYDMPQDVETYTHRIGRTGRAGASGSALLFVSPKEKYMIRQIERKTGGDLARIDLPTAKEMTAHFQALALEQLTTSFEHSQSFGSVLDELAEASGLTIEQLAQAMAKQLYGKTPLDPDYQERALAAEQQSNWQKDRGREKGRDKDREQRSDRRDKPKNDRRSREDRGSKNERFDKSDHAASHASPKDGNKLSLRGRKDSRDRFDNKRDKPSSKDSDLPMERFELAIGASHGAEPKHIVGCIANEAGLDGQHIQNIDIEENRSFVDLPSGMPKGLFQQLKKARVLGHKIDLKKTSGR